MRELNEMTSRGFRLVFVYEPRDSVWTGAFRRKDGSYSTTIAPEFETCVANLYDWSMTAAPWEELKPKAAKELSLFDLLR